MKLPSFKRIFKTDYPVDVRDTIERLAASINIGFESLYEALNRKVSLRDNIQCTVRDVEVSVDSSGNLTSSTGMSLDSSGRVDGITVLRVDNITDPTIYPVGQPFISFTQRDSSLMFNNITGLRADYIWRLRVVAWQY